MHHIVTGWVSSLTCLLYLNIPAAGLALAIVEEIAKRSDTTIAILVLMDS